MIESVDHWLLNGNRTMVVDSEELSFTNIVFRLLKMYNDNAKQFNNLEQFVNYLLTGGVKEEVDKFITLLKDNGELADIINISVFEKLNDYIKENGVSVSYFGAKGDGITDDTNAIKACWDFCYPNEYTMFFPNGTYIFNDVIKPTDIHKKVSIKGESPNGVVINNLVNNHNFVIDFSACNNVSLMNLTSTENKFRVYNTVPPSGMLDWLKINTHRTVRVQNVYSSSLEAGGTSWKDFTITEKPETYVRDFKDSRYATCPLELWNNSGYNTININNVNINDDGTIANPSDNSAIGITDASNGVAGVVYIDMYGERRFFKLARKASTITSGTNSDGIVFDISPDGHIGIGCSFLANDPNAMGVATIKARDNSPTISLYDNSNNNMLSRLVSAGTNLMMYHNGKGVFRANQDGYVTLLGLGLDMALPLVNADNTKGLDLIRDGKKNKIYIDSKGMARLATVDSSANVVADSGKVIQINYTGATSQRPTDWGWGHVGLHWYDQTLKKDLIWMGDKWGSVEVTPL